MAGRRAAIYGNPSGATYDTPILGARTDVGSSRRSCGHDVLKFTAVEKALSQESKRASTSSDRAGERRSYGIVLVYFLEHREGAPCR